MVIAGIWSELREQKARQEGLEAGRTEGRQESHARWEAWLQRWRDADAKGMPFAEPPPQLADLLEPPRW